MRRVTYLVLVLPLLLASVATAADGDRAEPSRSRDRGADFREQMRKRMEEATKKFDKDGDGKLDDAERRAMFESFRAAAPRRWSRRLWPWIRRRLRPCPVCPPAAC